eukprot:jgi/Bigna1/86357/estExt_fgenesh1_pg.C_100020
MATTQSSTVNQCLDDVCTHAKAHYNKEKEDRERPEKEIKEREQKEEEGKEKHEEEEGQKKKSEMLERLMSDGKESQLVPMKAKSPSIGLMIAEDAVSQRVTSSASMAATLKKRKSPKRLGSKGARSPAQKSSSKFNKNVKSKICTRFTFEEKKKMAEIRMNRTMNGARSPKMNAQMIILQELEAQMLAASPINKQKEDQQDEVDAKGICMEALKAGQINAYVDLFYLIHRGKSKRPDVDPAKLPFISDKLQRAEVLEEEKKYKQVYDCVLDLANYFREAGDISSALFFYNKCLEAANKIVKESPQLLQESSKALGEAHLDLRDPTEAVKFLLLGLEAHVDSKDSSSTQKEIRKSLAAAYEMDAKFTMEKGVDLEKAKQLLLKALNEVKILGVDERLSKETGFSAEEKGNHLSTALTYSRSHLELTNKIKDLKGEGDARQMIAAILKEQKLVVVVVVGKESASIEELQKCREVANSSDDLEARYKAARTLGESELSRRRYKEAVRMLEEAFDFAKQTGIKQQIDEVRVALGTAKGKMNIEGFMNVLQEEDCLEKVLAWKSHRKGGFSQT